MKDFKVVRWFYCILAAFVILLPVLSIAGVTTVNHGSASANAVSVDAMGGGLYVKVVGPGAYNGSVTQGSYAVEYLPAAPLVAGNLLQVSFTGAAFDGSAINVCGIISGYASGVPPSGAGLFNFVLLNNIGAGGTISPNTPQTINSGSITSFTVTPNAGYTASVGGTCGGSLVGNTYTTNAITANCTVVASFTINTYTVTPSAGAGGTISPSTPQTVNYGSTTAFTVTPNAGYTTSSVTGCGGTLSSNTYTTGPITADCTVTAVFKDTFTITTPNGPVEVKQGGSLQVSTAGASNVVVDGVSIGAVNVVTFINITGPHTITW